MTVGSSDPVTAAIESSIASATSGGDTGGGAADLSTSDPGDTGTSDAGSTGAEGGDGGDDGSRASGSTAGETTGTGTAGDGGTGDQAKPKGKAKIMPLANHEKVVKNIRDEYEKKLADQAAKYKDIQGIETPEVQARIRALDMAEKDPDGFAALVVQDGKLAASLRKALGITKAEAKEMVGDQPGAAGKGRVTPAASKAGERPKPNASYKTEDGREIRYYDTEGLEALTEWARTSASEDAVAQATAEARRQFEELYEERFGPIEKEVKAERVWQQRVAANKARIQHAQAHWPGYKQHEAAIQQTYLADKSLTLHDAYRIVITKAHADELAKVRKELAPDREKMRAELLAEMNGKANAVTESGVAAPAAATGAAGDGDAVTAAILKATRSLKRG